MPQRSQFLHILGRNSSLHEHLYPLEARFGEPVRQGNIKLKNKNSFHIPGQRNIICTWVTPALAGCSYYDPPGWKHTIEERECYDQKQLSLSLSLSLSSYIHLFLYYLGMCLALVPPSHDPKGNLHDQRDNSALDTI